MRAVLALEWLGEDIDFLARRTRAYYRAANVPDAVTDMLRAPSRKPWVARITGRDPRYGYARAFVNGQVDYSRVNSTGSRGVYLYYTLDSGVYQVQDNISWQRSERYFIQVSGDGVYHRITPQEVEQWLVAQNQEPSPDHH